MRKTTLVFLVVMLALLPKELWAQAVCGLNLEVQYPFMSAWNRDVHRSNIYEESDLDPLNKSFSFEENRKSIPITSGRNFGLRSGFSYRKCKSKWSFGNRVWFYRFSAPFVDTVRVSGSVSGFEGIRVGDKLVFPFVNTLEESGLSPIFYSNDNVIFPWTADFYAARTWENSSNDAVSVSLGLRFGGLRDRLLESYVQRVFIYEYNLGLHFEGEFFQKSQSEISHGLLVGPVVGVEGFLKKGKRFTVKASLTKSHLFGKTRGFGNSLYIENYWLSAGSENGPFTPIFSIFRNHEENLFSTEEKIAIGVMESDLTLYLAITKKFVLSVSGFISSWDGVLVAPAWTSLDRKWVVERRNLTFIAITVGLVFNFRSLHF